MLLQILQSHQLANRGFAVVVSSAGKRILAPSSVLSRQMSSASNKGQQGSSASSDEILVSSHETTRVLTLNRPKVFNALNLPMVRTMVPLLKTWRDNDLVDKVILKGTGSKAFCAGGDVKAIAEAGKAGLPLTKEFFREEYQLNHLIGTFNKPIIAIINGITMGGGVGLSVHAPIRIATENTLFSMPETAIGLFPDVGGSFFLPRLDGELGMFLGLTGHRLKGKDLLYAGIATHYIQSSRLEFVENQLLKASGMDVMSIADLLEDFSDDSQTPFSLQQHREVIDRCFSKGSVEEIIEALKAENSPWANEIVTALSKVSPTSLKLTFRQIRNGKVLDFLECFKMEFRLTQRVMKGKDFYEGIRAVLIDKDQKPMWNPSTLSNVLDLTIQKHFEALDLSNDGTADFQPFRGDSYLDYPHRKTALLSENEIIKIASRQPLTTFEQLYEKLRKESGYTKRGLKEKLQDVVQRRCQVLPGGIVSPKL